MRRLWFDEGGAILSVELILIMVMVVIGLVVGLKALRDTVDAKLVELSAAVACIDPGYGWGGIQYLADASTAAEPDGAWVAGSAYESNMAIVGVFGGTGSGAFEPAIVLTSEVVEPGTAPAIISTGL